MIRLAPFAAAAGLVWALSPISLVWSPAEARDGLWVGWVTAGLSGALSFGLLAFSGRKTFKTFVVSLLGGFIARLLLVGGGLLYAVHRGDGGAWFCLSFFCLYWVFLGSEFLAVRLRAQRQGQGQVTV